MMPISNLAERQTRATVPEAMPRRVPYHAPRNVETATLKELLAESGRASLEERQFDMLRGDGEANRAAGDVKIYLSGDKTLLGRKCVSVVGTREVTEKGWVRASRLARELAQLGVAVVSGLAKGVDTAALQSAIEAGGNAIAVIGTPLSKAYPAENYELQETIWQRHLLMSPFA